MKRVTILPYKGEMNNARKSVIELSFEKELDEFRKTVGIENLSFAINDVAVSSSLELLCFEISEDLKPSITAIFEKCMINI